MQRICFVLQVKPERLEEYKERHRSVWPEMQAALRETGWGNYSLFLRDDGLLVGYLETEDFERARAGMAKREVNERWQREMGDFLFSPMACCLIVPCNRCKKSFTCKFRLENSNESQPRVRRFFSLARRSRFRQFLCSLSRGEELGMGNLLAGWRILQLDYRSLDPRSGDDDDLSRVLHEAPMPQPVLGLRLRSTVGTGRPHLWPDHALSGDVTRHGRCARIHRRIRHIDASNFPWRVSQLRSYRTLDLGS
jgi:L-rhamnose mutarotase